MISVVCVYNNESIFTNVLLKSLQKQTARYELIALDNTSGRFHSAAEAYNFGGASAKGDYIMFVHQDMFLARSTWLEDVEHILGHLPTLGLAGVAGVVNISEGGSLKHRWRTSGGFLGEATVVEFPGVRVPEEVETLDECLLLIPRPVFDKLKFDETTFDAWHCYAADYCLSAKNLGSKAFVIPAPCNHLCARATLRIWEFKDLLKYQKRLYSKHSHNYQTICTWMGDINRPNLRIWSLLVFLAPLRYRLLPIQQSIIIKLLRGYEIVVNKLLPPGTRRHDFSLLPLYGIRVILNEGWRSFWLKSWKSILRPLIDKNKNRIQNVFIKYLSSSFSRKRMKIAAVTMVYNEALILPYFLSHYKYLDEIHVLYETDSTDGTLNILNNAPNVVIEKCHIEGGLDDIDKINLINSTLQGIRADWVYVVDPDEFIFPLNESPRAFLKRQNYDVVEAAMFQVYRHRTDKDLDPSLPPVPQRIHGDADLFSNIQEANRCSNNFYVKPNVVRPLSRVRLGPGHHRVEGNPRISPERYTGVHWQMADPSIALRRRTERKARLSERNKSRGFGVQNFNVTEEWIKMECDRHLDDPVIDALYSFSEERITKSLPRSLMIRLRKRVVKTGH